MRLCRNFSNLFVYEHLTERQRKDVAAGALTAVDADAVAGAKARGDVKRQVEVARETGYDEVEIDAGTPNPLLRLRPAQVDEARRAAEAALVALSMLLPRHFAAAAVSSPQEEDRKTAVRHLKRYVDVAERFGCRRLVLRPGALPHDMLTAKFVEAAEAATVKSLVDLAPYAAGKGMALHIGNNSRWENLLVRPARIVPVLAKAREKGAEVRFCFHPAQLFTVHDRTEGVEVRAGSLLDDVPDGLCEAIRVGDYVPERRLLHPPLHRETGILKEAHWVAILRAARRKGIGTVVVETTLREREDADRGRQVVEAETLYLRKVLEASLREPPPPPTASSSPVVLPPPA